MRCPHCQHDNRPGSRFCEECATALQRACAACGAPLSATAKFCPECAHPAAAPPARQFVSPEIYTPKHLAERILTSKAAIEGERKHVTILFADLKGSMELLADRDPEEARKLLDPVLERMIHAVHRYEGTVNQVMGDGIMALFGAPIAQEDHAARACYAALRMQDAVSRYAEELRRTHGVDVQIRVGVNSGDVVVRSIGSDLHMDYTAVGQTTHLAGRMEQLARPGSTLLTQATLREVEGYVEVKPLGAMPIRGLPEPVPVFELTGAGTVRTRLQASVARILSKYATRSATGRAAAVVINPDTGELLALGSYPYPSLTNGRPRAGKDDVEALIDRARFGLYPPGSTFKLVTATAALRQSASLHNSTFMCSLQGNGRVGAQVAGTLVRDDVLDEHPHGKIDMHEGLVQSCNAYFAQLAVRVGPQSILDTANLLGISVARDDSVARLRATLPQAGYGQGDVVATPLRMARVAAAIASGGVLRDVRLEKDVAGAAVKRPERSATHVLVGQDAAATLGRDLRDSVLNGTGRSLRGHPWRIAGKTGTAEVHDGQSHAWFIGYAPYGPAEKRVAFAVLIENAGYGGSAAAPAAGEIVTAAAASGLVR